MKTIETEVEVTGEGEMRIPLPAGIPPGKHAVVIVVDETAREGDRSALLDDFPVDSVGRWPAGLSLSREVIYGDRGR